MKRLSFYLFLILLSSCINHKKSHSYLIKVYRDTINLKTKKLEHGVVVEKGICRNDTEAFKSGLMSYYARVLGENRSDFKLTQTKSFKVEDKDDIDISNRLPQKFRDSLALLIKEEAENELKHFPKK